MSKKQSNPLPPRWATKPTPPPGPPPITSNKHTELLSRYSVLRKLGHKIVGAYRYEKENLHGRIMELAKVLEKFG